MSIGAKLTHFLRAYVTRKDDGTLTARLTGLQSSGALTSMAKANALLIVPETSPKVAKGDPALENVLQLRKPDDRRGRSAK